VTWTGSKFLAVGDSDAVLSSTDGITWTLRKSGLGNFFFAVTWNGSKFVAVGTDSTDFSNGTIATSPDGVTWTQQTPGQYSYNFESVIWTGTKFVAVGDWGYIYTSPDGVNWTEQYANTYNYLASITLKNNQFVIVGVAGTILTSPDDSNWTQQTVNTTNDLSAVTTMNNQLVAVGSSGTILTSTLAPSALFGQMGSSSAASVTLENGEALQFSLPEQSHVTLEIFNSQGRMVSEVLNETRNAGNYTVTLSNALRAGELSGSEYLLDFRAGAFHKALEIHP